MEHPVGLRFVRSSLGAKVGETGGASLAPPRPGLTAPHAGSDWEGRGLHTPPGCFMPGWPPLHLFCLDGPGGMVRAAPAHACRRLPLALTVSRSPRDRDGMGKNNSWFALINKWFAPPEPLVIRRIQ
jgi:hypothetical protein